MKRGEMVTKEKPVTEATGFVNSSRSAAVQQLPFTADTHSYGEAGEHQHLDALLLFTARPFR
jgi:hypothetical protein